MSSSAPLEKIPEMRNSFTEEPNETQPCMPKETAKPVEVKRKFTVTLAEDPLKMNLNWEGKRKKIDWDYKTAIGLFKIPFRIDLHLIVNFYVNLSYMYQNKFC